MSENSDDPDLHQFADGKRIEDVLRTSEVRYRRLFETATDGILILDADTGEIIDVNPFLTELTGYSHDSIVGKPLWEIGRLMDATASKASFAELQAKKHIRYENLPLETRDGRLIDVEFVSNVYPSDSRSVIQCNIRDISGRRQTERALEASETRYRRLFESAKDGILIIDADTGEIVDVNPFMAELTGYALEDFLQKHIWETGPFKDAASRVSFAALKAEEYIRYDDLPLEHRDGRQIDVEFVSTIYRVDGKDVIQCNIRDITERKTTERALHESEGLFRVTFEKSAIGKALATKEGYFLRVNEAFASMLGYRIDELEGRPFEEVTHADDIATSREAMETLLAGAATARFQKRYFHKDGRAVWVDANIAAIRDADGEVQHMVASLMDITERMAVHEELREAKELVEVIVENVPLMIFLKDAQDLRFVAFNRAGEELVGVDREDLLGKSDLDVFTAEQAASFMARDREVLAGNVLVDIPEEPILTAERGTRLLHTRKVCIRGSDGEAKYLLGISEDITEQHQAEEMRTQLEEQLRASQKLEAIGSLAGGVAHDFNNLLSVILSYTGFAMDGLRDGDPIKDDLIEVKGAGERAAALTRQLLAFSRKQVLQPVALSLNDVCERIEKMLRRILGEDIDLVQSLQPDLGLTLADPGQIEQVLMNLVVNARDAMPKGGKLTIVTSNVEIDEEYATTHVGVKPGSYVLLAVSDSGCGMDARTQARIFEPFFTTKSAEKGTGLGLSTAYGIVRQSGGDMWVYSELGHGTTFKVYLPRDRSAHQATGIKPSTTPKRATGTETILVVEDEVALRRVAVKALGAAGYTVLAAADGDEALLRSAQHVGEVHLLLTDVIMPRMGGRALAEELSKTRPTMRVLYMSGYTDDAIVHHGILAAGTQFLAKPFTGADLARKVQEVLNDGESALAGP